MGFIGRLDELTQIAAALDETTGGVLVVAGGRGSGRSRLINAAAVESGADVVRISSHEREWRYSGLSAVAAGLGTRRFDAVERVVRAAALADTPLSEVSHQVSQAFRSIPEDVALLIDDLDLIDEASASVLAYAFGRLGGSGIRIVATAALVLSAGPFGDLRTMRLSPLSRDDTRLLCAQTFPDDTSPGVLRIVLIHTDGNPGAIASAHLSPGELRGVDPVRLPLRLTSWSADVVESASTPAGALLRLVALGPLASEKALVAGDPLRRDAVEELAEAQVIDVHNGLVRLTDPTLRSSLHAGMGAEERREWHRVAARLHAGVDPRLEMWHQSFLDPPPDADLGLLVAARTFVAAHEIGTAVEFAERSLTLRSALPQHHRLLLVLVEALVLAGEFALADLYLARIPPCSTTTGLRLARACAALVVATALDHRISAAGVDPLIAQYGADEPGRCLALLTTLAYLHLQRWEVDDVEQRTRQADEIGADVSGSPATVELGAARFTLDLLRQIARAGGAAHPVDGRVAAAQISADGVPASMAASSTMDLTLVLRLLTLGERYDEARTAAAVLLNRGSELEPVWIEQTRLLLVLNEIRAGDLERTRDAVVAWRRSVLPEGTFDAVRGLVIAHAAVIDEQLGEGDGATVDALLEQTLELCRQERNDVVASHVLVLQGSRALAQDRYDEAVVLLRRAGAGQGDADPSVLRGDADLVESLWCSGRRREAEIELAHLQHSLRLWPSRWGRHAVARAASVCHPGGVGPSLTTVIGQEAPASSDERHRRRGVEARRLKSSTSVITVPGPPLSRADLERLDPQELAVAELVQRGLRNREIALMLYLSQRTVELRLTHVYRKLGIASRSHLAAIMSSRE